VGSSAERRYIFCLVPCLCALIQKVGILPNMVVLDSLLLVVELLFQELRVAYGKKRKGTRLTSEGGVNIKKNC
jgi:hypothetical protein